MNINHALITLFLLMAQPLTVCAQAVSKEQIKGLDEQVQDIKKDVLSIAAELSLLEEKLLFPSNTQVSIFISVVKNSQYSPDAVQIKIDDKNVAHHIYSFNEVEALAKGGVQRVFTGNLRSGEHSLEVSVMGNTKGSAKQTEKASMTINKDVGPKLVEISLGSGGSLITIKEQ